MNDTHQGTCFCGAVQIVARGTPVEMGYCHCGSCRSYTGAPFVAFILWRAEDVEISKGSEFLAGFNKVGTSDRRFCTRCGGHLLTYHPGLPYTDVYACKLPTVPFRPIVHLNYSEAVLPIRDGLPKLRDFPAHAGGSGEEVPEELPSPCVF
jgi:hypothetical protein